MVVAKVEGWGKWGEAGHRLQTLNCKVLGIK